MAESSSPQIVGLLVISSMTSVGFHVMSLKYRAGASMSELILEPWSSCPVRVLLFSLMGGGTELYPYSNTHNTRTE